MNAIYLQKLLSKYYKDIVIDRDGLLPRCRWHYFRITTDVPSCGNFVAMIADLKPLDYIRFDANSFVLMF